MEKTFLTIKEKADMLAETRWSIDLSWNELEAIAKYMEAYKASGKDTIFREGEKENYMCVVISGSVGILKDDVDSQKKKIASIGPGGFLGEMSIIDGSPRSATAVAEEDTVLMVFSGDQFELLVNQMPLLGVKVVMKLAKIMSQRLRQTSGVLVDYIETAI